MSSFEIHKAVRSRVPLIVGLYGASGSGKTFSALRLAAGIQSVVGGKIVGIDTEAKRMLHYADYFDFQHVPFDPPHSSLRYLEALKFAKDQGATVTIIDSASHEHEGEGGLLEAHSVEHKRLGGKEATKMLAWVKPKQDRRKLINGLLQLGGNVILCFRAKTGAKPVRKNGKTEVVQTGFVPIGADELAYEATLNCLLPPHSNGVPDWQPEHAGERQMLKLPRQFAEMFPAGQVLDESIGERLAKWAEGGATSVNTGEATAPPSAPVADDRPVITETDRKRLYAVMGERAKAINVTKDDLDKWLHAGIERNWGLDSVKKIPKENLPRLLDRIASVTEKDVFEAVAG